MGSAPTSTQGEAEPPGAWRPPGSTPQVPPTTPPPHSVGLGPAGLLSGPEWTIRVRPHCDNRSQTWLRVGRSALTWLPLDFKIF